MSVPRSRKSRIVVVAAAVFVALLCAAAPASEAPSSVEPVCRLRLLHTHTGEHLDLVYRGAGGYDPAALARVDHLLRDWRRDEVRSYDPRLLDLLHDLLAAVGRPDAEIDVVCGYRTPATNASLRAQGRGVARHSMHTQAMAIDLRVPGVPTAALRDAALRLGRGGVGYYAASDFVHVDLGRPRRW